jgi:hypothetical protein
MTDDRPSPWPLTPAAQARKSPVVKARISRCTAGVSFCMIERIGGGMENHEWTPPSQLRSRAPTQDGRTAARVRHRRPGSTLPPREEVRTARYSWCAACSQRSIAPRRIASSTMGLVM